MVSEVCERYLLALAYILKSFLPTYERFVSLLNLLCTIVSDKIIETYPDRTERASTPLELMMTTHAQDKKANALALESWAFAL